MKRWWDKFLKKKHYLYDYDYDYSSYSGSFISQIEEDILANAALVAKAKQDLDKLHPITKKIMDDLAPLPVFYNGYSSEPYEVRLLEVAKVIDDHIVSELFKKKLKENLND